MKKCTGQWEGSSLTVELAKRDLERKASERYKGFVVRSRLKKGSQRSREMQRACVKYEDFPISISSLFGPQTGMCFRPTVRFARLFAHIFVIALLTCQTSRFRYLAAI